MYFMLLVMNLCSISDPARCVERHMQYQDMTLEQCNARSIMELSKYVSEHPNYPVVKDWHCEVAGIQAKL